MSWLLGKRRTEPNMSGAAPPDGGNPPSGAGGGGDGDELPSNSSEYKKAMEAYRFDSSALERAAQAARELEKSRKFYQFDPLFVPI